MRTKSPPLTLDYETKGLLIFQNHHNFFYSLEILAKNVPVPGMIRKVFSYKEFRRGDVYQSESKGVSGFDVARKSFRHKFHTGKDLGLCDVAYGSQRFDRRLTVDDRLPPRRTTTCFSEESALGFRRHSPQALSGPGSSLYNLFKQMALQEALPTRDCVGATRTQVYRERNSGNPLSPLRQLPVTVRSD